MAGTSRRKSSRREPTSDIDEDPAPRRNRREEVDTDEEEQSQRARAKEKRSKGKARAQEPEPERQDVNMNQEESDDDVQIDVENFPDQALQQDGYRKLDGLASDWKTMADTIKNSSHAIENIAMGLAEASEGESVQKNLVKLEQLLKQLIDVESEMMRNEATLNGYAQEMRSGDEVVNVVKRYLGDVQANKVAYQKLTTRQKYAKNENYKSLKENLYAIDHPGEAMPPITEFVPKEPGDDSDDDDDLEVGGVTQDFKCPLTLRQLENPVTSKVCGHSFSREALKQLFANHRGAKMCPASGCNRSFTYNDCKPDNKLAQRMRIYIRRQQSASQNANDEIVE
ncbi:hypothetical protein Moror_13955 [Moniliophthora roreri MCA 2997]|uniref:SP-RING-type domain-containing protein n=1 Tax=Moniliophthora roreri (strain MCA 2997) TaxID=1381753 RepID=V2XQW9_MONRO|nr:hypothetical protein Moror_13955 [Moniliophthora roreri MCA 2997]